LPIPLPLQWLKPLKDRQFWLLSELIWLPAPHQMALFLKTHLLNFLKEACSFLPTEFFAFQIRLNQYFLFYSFLYTSQSVITLFTKDTKFFSAIFATSITPS